MGFKGEVKRLLWKRSVTNILLILGIVLVTIAFFVFPWRMKPENLDSYDPKGFILGTSETFFSKSTSVYIIFESLEVDKTKADVNLHINYVCENRSSFRTATFILQVPYKIDNVAIKTGAWNPPFFGGNTTVISPLYGLTYIIIQIPKENQTFGKLEYMGLQFSISNAFRKLDHCRYAFQFTFCNNFHDSAYDIELLKQIRLIDRLFFFNSKESRLTIEKPSLPYTISELTSQPDEIGYWQGKMWYVWDVKSRSSPHLISSSLEIKIENEDAKFIYETRISVTWFLLGLGIPIALSSFYQIWQEPRLIVEVVRKSEREPALHPRTGMAFYHLVVKNNGKSSAYDCELYISIKDLNGKELFGQIKGKWDRGPEPLGPVVKGGFSQIWPSLIPLTELVNVRPSVPESFCLVVKGKNEAECYAFNAYSYFYNFRNPSWRLGLGRFIAEIDVRGGNTKVFSKFIIENKGARVEDVTISKLG